MTCELKQTSSPKSTRCLRQYTKHIASCADFDANVDLFYAKSDSTSCYAASNTDYARTLKRYSAFAGTSASVRPRLDIARA